MVASYSYSRKGRPGAFRHRRSPHDASGRASLDGAPPSLGIPQCKASNSTHGSAPLHRYSDSWIPARCFKLRGSPSCFAARSARKAPKRSGDARGLKKAGRTWRRETGTRCSMHSLSTGGNARYDHPTGVSAQVPITAQTVLMFVVLADLRRRRLDQIENQASYEVARVCVRRLQPDPVSWCRFLSTSSWL